MALQVKPIDKITAKWQQRASGASGDYTAGVQAPKRSWHDATKTAEPAYVSGVQAGIARGAFGKGVDAAGDQKWKDRASTLGSQRYAGGVTAAAPAFSKGFGRFIPTIQGLDLPARGAKGSPQNYDRASKVGQALHAAKIGG